MKLFFLLLLFLLLFFSSFLGVEGQDTTTTKKNIQHHQLYSFAAQGLKTLNYTANNLGWANNDKHVDLSLENSIYEGTTPRFRWICSNLYIENQVTPEYLITEAYEDFFASSSSSSSTEYIRKTLFGMKEYDRKSYGTCISPRWKTFADEADALSHDSFDVDYIFDFENNTYHLLYYTVITFNRTGFATIFKDVLGFQQNTSLVLPKKVFGEKYMNDVFNVTMNLQISPTPRKNYSSVCNVDSFFDSIITLHTNFYDYSSASSSKTTLQYSLSLTSQFRVGDKRCYNLDLFKYSSLEEDDGPLSVTFSCL